MDNIKRICLTRDEFEASLVYGEILEQDERGVKVARMPDDTILKVFRIRHCFSISRIYSYAHRFCRNAKRLRQRGIPTVKVVAFYTIADSEMTAVSYIPLEGQTLRQLVSQGGLSANLAAVLGQFIATLHQQGVHFRSLHLGNIVYSADNQLGLIDIADLRVYAWPLFCNTRSRNFLHFCRYPQEIHQMGMLMWRDILHSYALEARVGAPCRAVLNRTWAKLEQQIFGSDK